MCYHGNEVIEYPNTDGESEDTQQQESMFKGKGGPTYASNLPRKHWDSI